MADRYNRPSKELLAAGPKARDNSAEAGRGHRGARAGHFVRRPNSALVASGVFINNLWSPAASGCTPPVIAPAERRVFGSIAAGGKEDVDRAVGAARRALEQGHRGRPTATERGRLRSQLARNVGDHAEELAQKEARDTGKRSNRRPTT